MNLFISTNLLDPAGRDTVFALRQQFAVCDLGLEIYPQFHDEDYPRLLDRLSYQLSRGPISFHEPYAFADHSFPKGSAEYHRSMEYYKLAFHYAASLNARHMVFHLNNRAIPAGQRQELLEAATENLNEMLELSTQYGVPLLIENAGVVASETVLLDQDQFIRAFDHWKPGCLLDVGHANCNSWEIETVLSSLQSRICCYHLHNNFGGDDKHNQILDGTFDMDAFFRLYHTYTPKADIVLEYRPDLLGSFVRVARDVLYVCRRLGHWDLGRLSVPARTGISA